MLATVMNSLRARDRALTPTASSARTMSAVVMATESCPPPPRETYARSAGPRIISIKGPMVVVLAGGTGNSPFSPPDTSAVAARCGTALFLTRVLKRRRWMGSIPPTPRRTRMRSVTTGLPIDEAIARDLKVMDTAAFALARDGQVLPDHRRLPAPRRPRSRRFWSEKHPRRWWRPI